MDYICLDENVKPTEEMQHRLNSNMKKVVRAKIIKLLDAISCTLFLIVHRSVLCELSSKRQESQ